MHAFSYVHQIFEATGCQFWTYLLGEIRIELIVPDAEQRGSDVKSFSIQTELNHLRSSFHALSFHVTRLRLCAQFRIFYHLHWSITGDTTTDKHLKKFYKAQKESAQVSYESIHRIRQVAGKTKRTCDRAQMPDVHTDA